MPRLNRLALCFPGQGYQRLGMLKEWAKEYPAIVQPILNELDEILKFKLSTSLISETEGMLNEKSVNMTSNAQPLLLTAAYSIFSVANHFIEQQGQKSYTAFLGHSLGEYTAWTAAGILPFAQAAQIVRKRGLAMERATTIFQKQNPSVPIGMTVVMIPSNKGEAARQQLMDMAQQQNNSTSSPRVNVANINSRSQIVLSGVLEETKAIIAKVSEDTQTRLKSRLLPVSGPFHSAIMAPGQETMSSIAKDPLIRWNWPPIAPVISNLSACPFESLDEVKLSLTETLISPVRWNESVKRASNNGDCTILSLGPGKIGKHTASEIQSETLYIEEPQDVAKFLAK